MINKLKNFDLNTLVALEALLELRHVSRAADRMHLSQPAMSRILGKLRLAFDDPLLVRIHAHHQLTERAQTLQAPLRTILYGIEQLMQPPEFIAARSRRTFRIALTDFSAQVFLPAVLQQIYREAPEVKIETVSLRVGMLNTEHFDRIDASICNRAYYGPCDLHHHTLFATPITVLMSKQHPLAKKRMTLDRYLQYPHVEVSLGGHEGTAIDELLKQQGRTRTVGLRAAHVTAVLPVLERTELLFSTAWQLLGASGSAYDLLSMPVPLDLPQAEYSVVWHPKNDESAESKWFRELLIRVINEDVKRKLG